MEIRLSLPFLHCVFHLHGIPVDRGSDRGPQLASIFCKEFCKLLGATASLPSGFHPQSNDQTEDETGDGNSSSMHGLPESIHLGPAVVLGRICPHYTYIHYSSVLLLACLPFSVLMDTSHTRHVLSFISGLYQPVSMNKGPHQSFSPESRRSILQGSQLTSFFSSRLSGGPERLAVHP